LDILEHTALEIKKIIAIDIIFTVNISPGTLDYLQQNLDFHASRRSFSFFIKINAPNQAVCYYKG